MGLFLRSMLILLCGGILTAAGDEVTLYPDGTGAYPTIQAAIDDLPAGSVIWLADGTWEGFGNLELDFGGKTLQIKSLSQDPEACHFNLAQGSVRAFFFYSGEGTDCLISGIGFSGSSGMDFGGVVKIDGASPRFENCLFQNNSVEIAGGCFYIQSSAAEIVQCRFLDNDAGQSGAALCLAQQSADFVQDCFFARNHAGMMGGAIEVYQGSPEIRDCIFWDNSADSWAGGAVHLEDSSPALWHCSFSENHCSQGSAVSANYSDFDIVYSIFSFGDSPPITTNSSHSYSLECCDLFGNTGDDFTGELAGLLGVAGNFSADPQFCGALGTGDFRLQSDSPCAPGNPHCPESKIGALDVGCGIEASASSSWSEVKSLY